MRLSAVRPGWTVQHVPRALVHVSQRLGHLPPQTCIPPSSPPGPAKPVHPWVGAEETPRLYIFQGQPRTEAVLERSLSKKTFRPNFSSLPLTTGARTEKRLFVSFETYLDQGRSTQTSYDISTTTGSRLPIPWLINAFPSYKLSLHPRGPSHVFST